MTIKIERVKVGEFIAFIKKLLSIDKLIYLKIKDTKEGPVIISNCYLPERDAVKLQQVPFAEIFETDEKIKKTIKMSFFNGNYLIDALKHFMTSTAISGEIIFNEIGEDFIATKFKLISDELSIDINCCYPSLGFQDLTTEQVKAIFNTESQIFTFDLDAFQLDKLNSLFNLDKEKETFKIAIDPKGVHFKSDVYDNVINPETNSKQSSEIMFYKKYVPLFDKESYSVTICSNKAVLKSKDTNTLITIASCQNSN